MVRAFFAQEIFVGVFLLEFSCWSLLLEISAEIESADVSVVRQVLTRLIGDDNLFIVDLTVRGHAGSYVVEAYLDSEDGTTVEQLASLGRRLGRDADMEERFGEGFRLTVSSPGLNKPLVDRRQYVRHTGKKLNVRWTDGDATRSVKGVLKEVGSDSVSIEKGNQEVVEIAFDSIKKATVDLPW